MKFNFTGITGKIILSLAALSILILSACGGSGGGGGGGGPQAPGVALGVTFNPPVGTPLLTTDTLTVTFPQAMNSGAATMSPTGGSWNLANTVYTFPVLAAGTLSISVSATDGATGTSQINLSNIDFNVYDPTATPFVYVSTAGNDTTGNGTIATPYATITKAESVAVSGQAVLVAGGTYTVDSGAATNVVIKDGVSLYGGYTANFSRRDPVANLTTITDVATAAASSLIATDFGHSDFSGTATCGTQGTPMAAISVGALSSTVIVDGFTINGSANSATVDSAAVSINNGSSGVLSLSNDTINGGAGSAFSLGVYGAAGTYVLASDTVNGGGSAGMSLGVLTSTGTVNAVYSKINGGSGTTASIGVFNDDIGDVYPNLSNNTITGGSGTNSYAVYSSPYDCSYVYPVLVNNTIRGGSGSSSSTGILSADYSYSDIYDNIVDGGTGPVSTGISVTDGQYSQAAYIWNNSISGGGGTTSSTAIATSTKAYADIEDNILLVSSGVGTQVCYNNVDGATNNTYELFYNNDVSPSCATALYSYSGTGVTTLAVATTVNNASSTLAALGNVSENPGFVSASDWHLTAASPAEVLQGGVNLVGTTGYNIAEPATDIDGIIRTATLTLSPTNAGAAGISMGAYEKN